MNNCLKYIPTLFVFGMVNAQEDASGPIEMITDRPDVTESSSTIPKGSLQVETGAFFESYEESNIKFESTAFSTTLLRYGLLENLELRLGCDFVEETRTIGGMNNEVSSGLSPLLFGMKVAIAEEKKGWPEMAFLGHLFLPFSASQDFKPNTTGANFIFAFGHSLSEKSSISYNIGGEWGDDNPEVGYIYSVAYGYGLSERWACYAELYGNLRENSGSNHFWDAGVTYLIKPNIQLDATVGTSITKGQDIYLSGGISFRIPR